MPPTTTLSRSSTKGSVSFKKASSAEIPTKSFSKEILHHFHKDEFYHVLILFLNSSPDSLSPMANVAVASSLAKLGRGKGCLQLLVQLADTAPEPSVRKLYLYALYRFLEEHGQRDTGFAFEVENGVLEAESFKYVPLLKGVFFCSHRYQSLYDQVQKYAEAGGVIPPCSFSAAVVRDDVISEKMKDLKKHPERIFEAIEEFGPWHSLAHIITSYYRENGTAVDRLERSAGSTKEIESVGLLGIGEFACVRASLSVIYFLSGNYMNSFTWCSRFFAATKRARRFSNSEGITGLSDKDLVTMSMVLVNCLERGLDVNISTLERILAQLIDSNSRAKSKSRKKKSDKSSKKEESPKEKIIRYVTGSVFFDDPELHEMASLDNPLLLLKESPQSFPMPMRQSQFFQCCGHLYRQMAAKSSVVIQVHTKESKKPLKARMYDFELSIEAARLYILAAACHPLDDSLLFRLYDRILWVLFLAGGMHARLIWLFLHARNSSSYSANFVPALRRRPQSALYPENGNQNGNQRPQSAVVESIERKESKDSFLRRIHSKSSPNICNLVKNYECLGFQRGVLPRPVCPSRSLQKPISKASEEAAKTCSGAALSPWPDFQKQDETLHHLWNFVSSVHEAVEEAPEIYSYNSLDSLYLSPSIFEYQEEGEQTRIFMAREYFAGQKRFKTKDGFRVNPELRSKLKCPSSTLNERYDLSKELARLWGNLYRLKHGDVPDWASEVMKWADL